MGNLFAKCIQRIFDDIIGSHAYLVSRNGFEIKMKQYFEYTVFRDIKLFKDKK